MPPNNAHTSRQTSLPATPEAHRRSRRLSSLIRSRIVELIQAQKETRAGLAAKVRRMLPPPPVVDATAKSRSVVKQRAGSTTPARTAAKTQDPSAEGKAPKKRSRGAGRGQKAIQNRLGEFLDGRRDLPGDVLAVLVAMLDVEEPHEFFARPSYCDFFNHSWVPAVASLEDSAIGPPIGRDLFRVVSATPRVIDAYVRPALLQSQPRYTSPGYSALYVLSGPVVADFFGFEPVRLSDGDLFVYDGAHPHRFSAADRTVPSVLDITINHEGMSSELFWREFPLPDYAPPATKAPLGHDVDEKTISLAQKFEWAWRANASIALHGARLDVERIAQLRGFHSLSLRRLKQLLTGTGPVPCEDELADLSYFLRVPMQDLFQRFDMTRRARTFKHYDAASIQKALRMDHSDNEWLLDDPESMHKDGHWKRRALFDVRWWNPNAHHVLTAGVMRIANSPHHAKYLYYGGDLTTERRRELNLRSCNDDRPGEHLLLVINGELEARFRTPGSLERSDAEGRLAPGDAVWFTSSAEFSLSRISSDPADVVVFWSPYPKLPPVPARTSTML